MSQSMLWSSVAYLYSELTKLLLISHKMNNHRKNMIYLKQVHTFQSNQITFKNLKSSLPLKRSEETKSQIKAHLLYIANSYFYNWKPSPCILHQHHVLPNLRKNKDTVIRKPDKGNGVVILYRKLYNNAIEETISDTSKFEKLIEDPILKPEASLSRSFTKVETKKLV